MKTEIIKIDPENINLEKLGRAAKLIRQGKLVVFPTETVYGLGANAFDEEACKNIFVAKGRPCDNPLIVHINNLSEIDGLVSDLSADARVLADKFWPGPLTMIFSKNENVSDIVTAKLDTVAVRMPQNKIARELIRLSGLPIAAPSANTSGKPSPTIAKRVIDDLNGKVDMIIDGGSCDIGLESTVLDTTVKVPCVLRPGGVTKEMIEELLGSCNVDPAIISPDSKIVPKSPGQKYRHYSPRAKVITYRGELGKVVDMIKSDYYKNKKNNYKIGIMATNQTISFYDGFEGVKNIGDRENLSTVANKLFEILREFDDDGVDIILSETFEEIDIGQAIMNRLDKATSEKNILK